MVTTEVHVKVLPHILLVNDYIVIEKSESIKSLAQALCEFQKSMEAISKDSANPFFKSKYASLGAIIEETRELLGTNGLSYSQFPTGDNRLATILMHSSGEWLMSEYDMKPVDAKPQSVGSAITYARRYALSAILGLQVEDDDGNEASGKRQVYDTSPVPDRVKVTVAGADKIEATPTPAPVVSQAVLESKKKIQFLCDSITISPLESKEEYETYVRNMTGLNLVPSNYKKIIERLEAVAHGEEIEKE